MKPITVRRIVLAAASFVLALLSLLSLCFVVGKADLGLGGAGGSAVSDLFSDSGFHLLGGETATLSLVSGRPMPMNSGGWRFYVRSSTF